ncbi:MAG: hypothetical protein RL208_477 [Pseudomonadota bacterium]|jgi:ribonucleotide reductase beta subunit family protein with ferritin-like domain
MSTTSLAYNNTETTYKKPEIREIKPTKLVRSLVINKEYQPALEFTEKQLHIFWLPEEIKLEKDIQDIKVNMTLAEQHGVITTLKLFSLYEDFAGEEYWGSRFKNMFSDNIAMTRMASTFSMFENAIHLPFYNKINELLSLDTDDFYNSYVNDPTLYSRMSFIDSIVSSDDDLVSLGGFSMVEGAILYSSFAFLKHFQSQGKNKLLNLVRGINFSVRDECTHHLAGAWAFKLKKSKMNLSEEQEQMIQTKMYSIASKIYEHEERIVDMIFEKGHIDGITPKQMKNFVQSRINNCLHELGYKKLFEVTYNPVSDWFYDGINGFMYNDFFTGIGAQYNRNWSETGFTWKKKEEVNNV